MYRSLASAVVVTTALSFVVVPPVEARVVRLEITERTSPDPTISSPTRAYERIAGRAHGELDPNDPLNAIITDLEFAPRNSRGMVEYTATFQIVKPIDMARASGLMWHDVPNRGGRITIVPAERELGDVGLSSGWQGDNSSMVVGSGAATSWLGTAWNSPANARREYVIVPSAKNRDGSSITGTVFGRIVNRAGPASQPIIIQTNPMPYAPASLDTTQARLTSRAGESMTGEVTGEAEVTPRDWAWGRCGGTFGAFPGKFDATQPTHICLRNGFDPKLLYQVVYPVKDPYVLGVGFAAWRDVGSFFKYATRDDLGTPNPLAGRINHSIGRGVSQSGNYLRGSLHLGFNQDEAKRRVHDGLWPIIAGRRIAMNFRWAQPDGVLELYQAGSEGPQWWARWPDAVRGLPPRGILDRCERTKTCPKIIEHFGSAEVWALKLTPEWVGTGANVDIPLPDNVRRYYIASSGHGGGVGGFDTSLPGKGLLNAGFSCPGNNFGAAVLPPNPMPHVQTVNALRVHFRNWVMSNTAPPDSVYPRLGRGAIDANDPGRAPITAERDLVDADQKSMGFPSLPALAKYPSVPSNFIMPVLDYDFGPSFNYSDGSGVPSVTPPRIKQVIRALVPRVNADGNEVGGVPVVLHDAPLGTYLGWNITDAGARPFHAGQICNYAGGMIPFARTKAERAASGDPRLSLEERYGNHAGYVEAVRKAATNAVAKRFLLQIDAEVLISQAAVSQVLK